MLISHGLPAIDGQTTTREEFILAPYAFHSGCSRGRRFEEAGHPYRGPFQRDRDRIVHSAAYRRLSGKLQVFTGEFGDYHRTRLTHTHEVASVARTLGRVLRLNEDFIEALALVHDIGHPPFGHAGEEALNQCVLAEGGFSHNQFALTLVEELERPSREYAGLNLTYEVLAGQTARVDKNYSTGDTPLLEIQLVDAADSVAYNAHDTDDALELKLITLQQASAHSSLVAEAAARAQKQFTLTTAEARRKAIVHELVERQVSDLLIESRTRIEEAAPQDAASACRQRVVIGHSAAMAAQKRELSEFLFRNVYRHPRVVKVCTRGQERLQRMFDLFCDQPGRLPVAFHKRSQITGVPRAAVEYLASHTDRSADREYLRQFPV